MRSTTPIVVAGPLSAATLNLLTDLVEIRLSCMEVYDRDDARELRGLERASDELRAFRTPRAVAARPAVRDLVAA